MSGTTKITSPVEGLFTTSAIGPLVLDFRDSVAEVSNDALTPGIKAYLKDNGYGIGDSPAKARDIRLGQAEPADPRKVNAERVGAPIRDAAVDPKDKDFLAPINAGKSGQKGNPHSSNVVSPEIHASEGIRPVKGGPVHVDDPGAQDASEKAHAADATDGTAVTLTQEERDLLGLDDDLEDEDLSDAVASAQTVGDPNPQGDPDSESSPTPSEAGSDSETPVEELKGEALTEALKAADLPVSGSAQEKRDRLAAHRNGA